MPQPSSAYPGGGELSDPLLEERLGVPLFARFKGRVSLTEAGRRAAPAVSAGFEAIADAFAAMAADDGGVLTVSTTATFASNWLAPRLGSFQLARPELAVRLNTDNRVVDFAARRSTSDPQHLGRARLAASEPFLFRLHSTPLCSPISATAIRCERPPICSPCRGSAPMTSGGLTGSARPASPCRSRRRGAASASTPRRWRAMQRSPAPSERADADFWRGELAGGRLVQLFDLITFEGRLLGGLPRI